MRTILAILLSLPLWAGGGTVAFKQTAFMAEVAATDQEKAKGLMYRQSLAKDRCMFFVYGEEGYLRVAFHGFHIDEDVDRVAAWLLGA